jgi:predicted lysophospholipase L1 biosynthesis ABC-type transport system permease subunit
MTHNSLLFWLSYAARSLRRSGSRGLFAIACVAVGVAGVVALQTATLTIQDALTSNVRAANGGDISLSTQESPLAASDLQTFKRLQTAGKITAWTAVWSLHATAVGNNRQLIPFDVNVVSSPPYPLGGQPTFVSPSNGNVENLLQGKGSVLVSSVLADELGVGVGSRVFVNGIGGPGLHAVIRGVLSETSFEHAALMTVPLADASLLGSGKPHYTAVYANASSGIDATAQSLRAQFPAATIQTVPEALNNAQLQVHDFRQFMLLVGLLALLIAGIGILNAMQSALAQRRLEIAMLKAIGFRRGTLYALFGTEALLVGLIGGVIGTVVGALASKTIADALARALAIQVNFIIDGSTLAAGIGLGVGAALIFAVLPIVRAAALRPIEVLREGAGAPLTGWPGTVGLVAIVILLFTALASVILGDTMLAVEFVIYALLAAAVLTGLFSVVVEWIGRLGPARSLAVGVPVLVGLVLLSIVLAMRAPALAPIAVLATAIWAATVLVPRRLLLALLIAVRALSRRRMRTSVTLVAFLAGVLAMTITLTVALSLRNQINTALANISSTNLVAITSPDKEQSVVRQTQGLSGVKDRTVTVTVQTNPIAINGQPLSQVIGPGQIPNGGDEGDNEVGRFFGGVTGYDLAHNGGPSNIRVVDGSTLTVADAGTNHVLVRSILEGPPYNLSPGSTVTLKEAGTGKTATVQVVGFYARPRGVRRFSDFNSLPVYGDRSLAVRLGGSDAQAVISLTVDPNNLASDATTLQREAVGSLVIDIGSLVAVVEQILNELLNVLAVITALVLGAGVAVVANGVGLAMLERRREIALFKAIGFGPSRVLQFVLLENAILGSLAGAVSVLIAAILLALISHFALQQAVGFDPGVAMIVLLIAIVLAVVTAYLTARRPLRIRPIEALRNE